MGHFPINSWCLILMSPFMVSDAADESVEEGEKNDIEITFQEGFSRYHILSGKIITFSLAVMYIYILKAALLA